MTTTTPQDGFWVITVDRRTGKTTTSPLIHDSTEAWQKALDWQSPVIYTTVVGRREI